MPKQALARTESLEQRLAQLPAPCRVAMIGAGAMRKGLLYQCGITPGFQCVALADVALEKAIGCACAMRLPYRVVSTAGEMRDTIRRGELALCEDGALAANCSEASVLIEASSAIGESGLYAAAALEAGKHVVMMNAEADLIFGPHLMALARERELVYTSCDGDQHGVIARLIEEVKRGASSW